MSNLSFRDFEYEGWERVAASYGKSFESATRLFVSRLLDAAQIKHGMRVLDLACGTGIATSLAAARGAKMSGVDFSPAMLKAARQRYPALEFREADASALPFEEEEFDVVIANFGMNHFAFPLEVLAETRRVLKPEGRVVFTVWGASDDSSFHSLTVDAVCAVGDPGPALPSPPDGMLDSVRACLRLLEDAGFDDTACNADVVEASLRLDSAQQLIDILVEGTVHPSALLRTQWPERAGALREAMERGTGKFQVRGSLKLPVSAVLASGTK
ncbi:MAG: class I SAM-dependent methyltransferase [Burkholderiales bacterium]